MQGIRFVRLALVRVVPLALGMLAAVLSGGQAGAAGGEDAIAWYRSLAGHGAVRKAQNIASGAAAPARGKGDARADFYERIRPYLSAGGYYSLFGAGPGTRAPGAPLPAAPRAPVSGSPNELVNDPTGEACFPFPGGCTQSEPSIAVSGSNVVIGFNDSKGSFDGTHDIS